MAGAFLLFLMLLLLYTHNYCLFSLLLAEFHQAELDTERAICQGASLHWGIEQGLLLDSASTVQGITGERF